MTEQIFTPPKKPDPHETAAAYALGAAIQREWSQQSQDEMTTPPATDQTPELEA